MRLEQQVVSLDIAKRLKELGVKQESYFVWMDIGNGEIELWDKTMLSDYSTSVQKEIASAFTVAELGQLLRNHTYRENLVGFPTPNRVDEKGEGWQINKLGGIIDCPTEADARGKMLIYLLENKLI